MTSAAAPGMNTSPSRTPYRLGSLVSLSVVAATLASTGNARADIPELSAGYPARPNNASKALAAATLTAANQGVNIADCQNTSDVIVVDFDLSGVANWQSADEIRFYSSLTADSCQNESVRSDGTIAAGTGATCNRVAAFALSYAQGSSTGELAIPLGLVVAGSTEISGATTPYFNTDVQTNVDVSTRRTFTEPSLDLTKYCHPVATAGDGPQTIYLHAILFQGTLPLGTAVAESDAGTSSSTVEATVQINFDLWGPQAPTGLSVGVGDTLLFANWTSPSTSTDLAGYSAYCYSNPMGDGGVASETGTVDAGAEADAGAIATDASGETQGAVQAPLCPSGLPSDLKTGATVNADLHPYQCATSSAPTATTLEIQGLTDQQDYAVFVAGVDDYGNPGTLSTELCGFPVATNDLPTAVVGAGGSAGGGFCSVSPGPSGDSIATWMAACVGILVARRARRRGEDLA
jgi:hypothetical protein